MNDNLKIANERSGLNKFFYLFLITFSFLFGVVISVGVLSGFGQPTDLMLKLLCGSLIPFVIIIVPLVIVCVKRDKILKDMGEKSDDL